MTQVGAGFVALMYGHMPLSGDDMLPVCWWSCQTQLMLSP